MTDEGTNELPVDIHGALMEVKMNQSERNAEDVTLATTSVAFPDLHLSTYLPFHIPATTHCAARDNAINTGRAAISGKVMSKVYECDLCEYSTNKCYNLTIHKRVHSGEKPHKCAVCPYSTSHSHNLTIHMRTHTGERMFTCDKCDFSTSQSNNLRRHIAIHTGRKHYKCDMCEYSATRADHLSKHRRAHIVDSPHKCDVCTYSTNGAHNLVRHKRIHASEAAL